MCGDHRQHGQRPSSRQPHLETFTMIDSLSNKKVLVTGACGFMGSHLVDKLLEEGASVLALDRPEAFLVKANRKPSVRPPRARHHEASGYRVRD